MGDDAEREAREWIEAVTGEHLAGTLQEALASGVVLCRLLNVLKPGAVKKPSTKKMPFMQSMRSQSSRPNATLRSARACH